MPPKAEPKEKSEAEILREELASLRGELTTVTTRLNEANASKVQAELATMTEGERRFLAEETAADNAIASAENEATALEGQLAGLWSEGKFAEAAGIQRKIAAAVSHLENETMRKQYLASQREALKAQRTTHAATPVPQAQASGAEPSVQAWIDSHPRFKSWTDQKSGEVKYADKQYHDAAMAGHYAALARGKSPGARDYFEIVETHTGDRQTEHEESPYSGASFGAESGELDYRVERPQSRAAGPGAMGAAAPSRAAPGSSRPGRPPDLTADQREVADELLRHVTDPAERYTQWARFMEKKGIRNGASH